MKMGLLRGGRIRLVVSKDPMKVLNAGSGPLSRNCHAFFSILPSCAQTWREPETPVRKLRGQKL